MKAWDTAIEKVVVPANTLQQGQAEPAITGVEQARLAKARNCIRCIFDLGPDGGLAPGPEVASSGKGGSSASQGRAHAAPDTLATAKDIKLSALVDITMETKLAPLQQATIDNLLRQLRTRSGGCPQGRWSHHTTRFQQ